MRKLLITIIKLIFLGSVFVLSFSCTKGNNANEPDDSIKLSQDTLVFNPEGESQTLTVTSTGKWSVSNAGSGSWYEVTPDNGSSKTEITITVSENESVDNRTATIVFVCGDATAKLEISQFGKVESGYVDMEWDKNTITNYDKNTGIITIQSQNTLPTVGENSVIVLPQEYEYEIRVIKSYSVVGKTLTIQTEQGNMSNLFKNISFTLSTDPSLSTVQTKSSSTSRVITPSQIGIMTTNGYKKIYDKASSLRSAYDDSYNIFSFNEDFSGQDLYNKNGQRVYWEKGIFDIGLKGVFSFDFGQTVVNNVPWGELEKFEFYLDGNLNIDLLLQYTYSIQSVPESKENLLNENIIPRMDFTFMVGTVPVMISVKTDLYDSYDLNANAEISLSTGCNFQSNAKLGLTFVPSTGIIPIKSFTSSFTLYPLTFNAKGTLTAKGSIYPKITFGIYSVLGPWVKPMPYLREDFEGGMRASTDGNNYLGWTSKSYAGLDCQMGLDLDFAIWHQNIWTSDIYNLKDALLIDAPNKIELTSPTDGTKVTAGTPVNVSFYLSYLNNLTGIYFPCWGALVNFSTQGSVNKSFAVSDTQGSATVQWTPKNSSDHLTATIVDKDGQTISEATFTPTYDNNNLPPVDENGLTDSINNIVPPDILQKLEDLGVVINGGNTPPNIEGTYLVSPLTLVKSSVLFDVVPGTVYWIGNGIMDLTFSEQNNANLTVKLSHTIGNDYENASGLGAFITGDGNKFSVFVEAAGTDGGYPTKSVEIHSGEITANGIENYQWALIITESAPTTIPEGQGRLWKDGDGFSERINQNSAPAQRKTTQTTSGDKIFKNTLNQK